MPAGQRLGWAELLGWSGQSRGDAPRPCAGAQGARHCPPGETGRISAGRSVVLGARGSCLLSFFPLLLPPRRRRAATGTRGTARVAARVPPSARQGRAIAAAAKAGTAFSEGGLVPALPGGARGGWDGEGALARPRPHDPARPPPARARHLLRSSPATAACERGLTDLSPVGRQAA